MSNLAVTNPHLITTASQLEMKKGSKSFSMASFFFREKERSACYQLYHWCRHCDDQIDQAPNQQIARLALNQVWAETLNSYRGFESSQPAFRAFHQVSSEFQIPQDYALDLLAGFSMDVDGFQVETEKDLNLYCYHVAGVVGLMMCQIMGLNNPKARLNAVELGIGMQMTNIARDIFEDFENGRCYLPETWLKFQGIDRHHLFADPKALFEVLKILLQQADKHYRSGFQGLNALPLRAALAVSIAGSIYSGIGRKLLRLGPDGLRHRTYLKWHEKIYLACEGSLRILPIALQRIFRPWKPTAIKDLWNYTA